MPATVSASRIRLPACRRAFSPSDRAVGRELPDPPILIQTPQAERERSLYAHASPTSSACSNRTGPGGWPIPSVLHRAAHLPLLTELPWVCRSPA